MCYVVFSIQPCYLWYRHILKLLLCTAQPKYKNVDTYTSTIFSMLGGGGTH